MKVLQEFIQCSIIVAWCAAPILWFVATANSLAWLSLYLWVPVIYSIKLSSEQYQMYKVLLGKGLLGRQKNKRFDKELLPLLWHSSYRVVSAGMCVFYLGIMTTGLTVGGLFFYVVGGAIAFSGNAGVHERLKKIGIPQKVYSVVRQKMLYVGLCEFSFWTLCFGYVCPYIYRAQVPEAYRWVLWPAFDTCFLTFSASVVGPALTKVWMMPVFGDFTETNVEKNPNAVFARKYCCKLGERAYAIHHVAFAGHFSKVYRYRINISKFGFIFGSMLTVAVLYPKDIWYNTFHFVIRFNPALFVNSLREKRRSGFKVKSWKINDTGSKFCANDGKNKKVWKLLTKFSVDWVPHWARCMYSYQVYYPLNGLCRLRKVHDSGKPTWELCNEDRKAFNKNPSPDHTTRTGYYSLGGFLMRVCEMPGFYRTDSIAAVHYRRYLQAQKLDSFAKYLTYTWLEIVDEKFDGMEDEVSQVVEALGEAIREAEYPSIAKTFIGEVPREQMLQFQYVVTVFQWRSHFQCVARQSVKVQLWTMLLLAMILLVVIRELAHKSGTFADIVCLDNIWRWFCLCRIVVASGGLGLMHLARGAILLMLDVFETINVVSQQKKHVQNAFRELVFDFGTVGKEKQFLWVNSGFMIVMLLAVQFPYSVNKATGYDFRQESPSCSGFWGLNNNFY